MILEKGKEMPKGAPLSAYMYMILQANTGGLREVMTISDATLEEVLEEFGLTAKWEAKGWEQGRQEDVKRLQKYGMEPEQLALALELPLDTVFRYLTVQ
jgi:predicted transposase YdaD